MSLVPYGGRDPALTRRRLRRPLCLSLETDWSNCLRLPDIDNSETPLALPRRGVQTALLTRCFYALWWNVGNNLLNILNYSSKPPENGKISTAKCQV